MLVTQKRPRNLSWYHAGPLLYGDWGTSRLYVLGLAFAGAAFGAPIYLLALSLLMVGVAWAYVVVCRSFPDGGGVYTAARQLHPMLAVVGATMLLADYIVTAAISLFEAFHYFGVPEGPGGVVILACCLVAIAGIGALNWFGARTSGRFALFIAVTSMGFCAMLALAALPFVPRGIRATSLDTSLGAWDHWSTFAGIILALSGVEAVANMTGLMKQPVAQTARRTIWPVLAEVATLNIVFIVALVGVKAAADAGLLTDFRFTSEQMTNAAMKVLAIELGQHWFGQTVGWAVGKTAAVVFGLLLISAANTAIMAIVAVLYALAQDHELPRRLTKLNYSGVPALGLLLACVAPALLLAVQRDLQGLASLYAIGVCGAITLNLGSCAVNRELRLSRAARAAMGALALLMLGIWCTIAVSKPMAAVFAGALVGGVLAARQLVRMSTASEAALPEPEIGWLAELRREPLRLDAGPRIMLAARGRYQAEFAVDLARRRHATLFAIFVRTLRVLDLRPETEPRIEADPEAQESLGTAAVLARRYGVPFVPIYVCSTDIAGEILDYTVTYGCDTLVMGKSRRTLFSRRLEGDVVGAVAQSLPDGVALITREATPHPMGPPPPDAGNGLAPGARARDGAVASDEPGPT